MKHLYSLIFLPILMITSMLHAEGPCNVQCKQNMPITLGYNCQYTLQPDDILHYPPPSCQFVINVYNAQNQPIGPTVNGTHVGQTLNVKVSNGAWYCWASIVVSGGSGGGPVAICDVNTQVSLGSDGTARVYWQTFDDGSYVNCGAVAQIKVRRKVPGWCPPNVVDDTQFRDYVEFCCEDVQNSPVKVVLRVYDNYGNYNDCWVNVYVEDHLNPHIYCPPDITVSCDYPIDYNHLGHFGKVHMNPSNVQPIYINDPHYYPGGHAGYDGYVGGGACGGGNLWVVDSYYSDFTCGTGIIYRTFTIENTNYSCVQKIYVRDPYPFNGSSIYWPPHKELPGCGANNLDPEVTGKPTWQKDDCSIIATSYRDEVFTIVPDACFKVLRHWSVLDWCTYKPNDPYGRGRWNYTQVIKLKNSAAPTFPDCNDVTFCTTDVYECNGKAPLYGNAYDDCTPDSLMRWHWCIDINNDGVGHLQGNYDVQGYTRNASAYYPFGTHKVLWRVEDLCGKFNTCEYLFTVEDCKKPSPVCLGAISTVVMPASGMIELNARHFDASSFDNCTKNQNLIFSYSPDITETTRIFTCNNIGTNELEIWVTDEAGNQQYCTSYLVLDDNDNVCPNTPMPLVSGSVMTKDGEAITGTEVSIETGNINIKNYVKIGADATFDFGSFAEIPSSIFPVSISKSDDALNGVSVLDLLLMQKHILELKTIADPYVLVAADVNGDNLVDARDLLETKLVMLNRRGIFTQNTSWLYIQDIAHVDPQFAPRNNFDVVASTDNPTQLDIIGIKIGDLNGSATLGLQSGETRSSKKMSIADQFISTDDEIMIPISFSGVDDISGFHLNLDLNAEFLTVIDVVNAEMEKVPFELNEGSIQILHVNATKAASSVHTIMIKAKVNKTGWLSEAISSERGTNAVVDENEEEFKVKLSFDQGDNGTEASELVMQILPNPFMTTTDLLIANDLGETGEIQIIDQTGKTVIQRPIASDDRVVRFTIIESMLPASGLYWIKTQLGGNQSIDKLMLLR